MARSQSEGRTSIYGRRLQLADAGNLTSYGKPLGSPCVDVTCTITPKAANVNQIACVFKDAEGNALDYSEEIEIVLFLDAARAAYAVTGGSTGLALGTAAFGAIRTITAKKVFAGTCKNDGTLSLQFTDTGSEVCFLGFKLPGGGWVMSTTLNV